MFFHELETKRLLLKNIGPDDDEFILRQFSNDEVNRYLFDMEPFSDIDEARELIGFYNEPEPRGQHRWILVLKATGEKIGTCGFHCWDRERGVCELGYDLYPDYWACGYMREALGAVIPFARDVMELSKIEAHISTDNERSKRAVEAMGFADTGDTYMEHFRGADYPHMIYALSFRHTP